MSLLLRLFGVGVVLGALTIIALQFPPFPPEFGVALYKAFGYIFALNAYIPTKLAVNLYLILLLINALVLTMRGVIWLYNFILPSSNNV